MERVFVSLFSLIAQPYGTIARIAVPILAIGGAYAIGDIHGHRAENTRLTGKYEVHMTLAKSRMDLTAEHIRRARAEALAADMAHAREVETAQDNVRKEADREIADRVAAARADALRMFQRSQTAGGHGSVAGVSSPARAAVSVAGAGKDAELDDLNACAEAVVKAKVWLGWYTEVSAIPR